MRRRSIGLRSLALVAVFGIINPGFGSPGSVLDMDVPILGGEKAATRDIQEGDASVSTQTGAFTYSYPIAVPPGRLGMQPSLTLSYSSQAPLTGGLAAGWSLALPTISRDPSQSHLARQSSDFVPRWVSSMAGGHELIPVSEPTVAADVMQAFRAQYDGSYTRYERLNSGTWRARTTDGLTHELGLVDHEEGVSDGWRFSISRSTDSFGNQVNYFWQNISDEHGHAVDEFITRIDYTTNPTHGIAAPHARVEFEWEPVAGCAGLDVGAKLEFTDSHQPRLNGSRRLEKIHTKVADGAGGFRTVRTITLMYDAQAELCDQPNGPLRLLTSIQEQAFAPAQMTPSGMTTPPPVTLPAVTFNYGPLTRTFADTRTFDGVGGADTVHAALSGGLVQGQSFGMPSLETTLVDMDGDGRLDAVQTLRNSSVASARWIRNTGSGFVGVGGDFDLPVFRDSNLVHQDWSLLGHMSDKTNLMSQVCDSTQNLGIQLSYKFLDVNADGLPDLATALNYDPQFFSPDPVAGDSNPLLDGNPDPSLDWNPSCQSSPPAIECPDLAPDDKVLPETCDGRYACWIDEVAADDVIDDAPTIDCGELMKPGPDDPNPQTCSNKRRRQELRRCGNYYWKVHLNVDGEIDIHDPARVLDVFSPVPLDSNGADTAFGVRRRGGFSSDAHAVLDFDGDGFLDVMVRDARLDGQEEDVDDNFWLVWRGDGTGRFWPRAGGTPYLWSTPLDAQPSFGSAGQFELAQGETEIGTSSIPGRAGIMDATGDGIADFLWLSGAPGDSAIGMFANTGGGFISGGAVNSDLNQPTWSDLVTFGFVANAVKPPASNRVIQGDRRTLAQPIDFDGDGRLDFYDARGFAGGTDGNLYVGSGSGDIQNEPVLIESHGFFQPRLQALGDNTYRLLEDMTDIDGDGEVDWVTKNQIGQGYTFYTEPEDRPAMRLMNSVDNGLGRVTGVTYRPSSSNDVDIEVPEVDESAGMPTHIWLVESMTTTDAANPNLEATTHYDYGEPVWNADQRGRYGFRGFTMTRATRPLGSVIDSTFDYSVDWSGRQIETTTYFEADAPSVALTDRHPESIEQTDWDDLTLFSGAAISFQPTETREFTCSNGQTRAQCLASAPRKTETITWLSLPAASTPTGPPLVWYRAFSKLKRGSAYVDGDRRYATNRTLYAGTDFYRLRPERVINHERVNGVDEISYLVDEFWTTNGTFNEKSVQRLSHPEVGPPAVASVSGATWRYNDLGLGLVTATKNPNQSYSGQLKELINYGENGEAYKVHPTSTVNELGHKTWTTYDLGTGALLVEQGPNSTSCGTGCTELEVKRTIIDGLGRPLDVYVTTEEVSPAVGYREKRIKRMSYVDTAPQRVIEEDKIDWEGANYTWTETTFDGSGRVVKRDELRAGPHHIDTFLYDEQGNLDTLTTNDPSVDDGSTVVYDYKFDPLDRVIGIERPDGAGVEWSYDGLTATRREVGDSGPLAETRTTTDVFGRLVRVDEVLVAGTPGVATTLYQYDANDNVKQVTNPDLIITAMTHDLASRRTSITRGARTWKYTYDRNGNMLTERVPLAAGMDPVIDGPRYTVSTGYDALDRPTSRTAGPRELTSGATGQQTEFAIGAIAFSYDTGATNAVGRLVSAKRASGTTSTFCPAPCNHWLRSFDYDARGNVKSDTLAFNLQPSLGASVLIKDSRTITRAFNPSGGVVQETHGDGSGTGGLTGATVTTTSYDERGLPQELLWTNAPPLGLYGVLATATRNAPGALTQIASNLAKQDWVYDSIGRVVSMTAKSTPVLPVPAVEIKEEWEYFATDDPALLTSSRGTDVQTFSFSFDDRHQLTDASAVDAQFYEGHFGYSNGGRVTSAEVASDEAPVAPPRNVTYQYLSADPVVDPEAPKRLMTGAAQFMVYGYDIAGNVTSRDEDGVAPFDFTFLYDGEDQQRLVTSTAAGQSELYHYDHTGARILAVTRQGTAVTKVRLWHGSLEVEYSPTGAPVETLTHVGLGVPIARIENHAVARRLVHGQLGHMLGAFNNDGTALESAFFYGPFGEILSEAGSSGDYSRRFNGKEHDQLADLYYYGKRYFDPLSLTWTQADPVFRFAPDLAWDQPRLSNLYTFDLNNPVRYLDPDGLCPLNMCYGPGGGNPYESPILNKVVEVSNKAARVATAVAVAAVKVAAVAATATVCAGCAVVLAGALAGGSTEGQILGETLLATTALGKGSSPKGGGAAGGGGRAATGGGRVADSAVVCRGGTCTAERFSKGTGVTTDAKGKLHGVSVNAGETLEEASKGIKNKQVGASTAGDVRAAGGEVTPSPTPNNPNHCTMSGICADTAEELFTPTVPNPHAE